MAEIVARFADGRLLVQESRLVEQDYLGSGVPVRIGHVRQVEKVLSLDTNFSDKGLITSLSEVAVGTKHATISGSKAELPDHIRVIMRRGDPIYPFISGFEAGNLSGGPPIISSYLNAMVSGVERRAEIRSGNVYISGRVRITANIIGY